MQVWDSVLALIDKATKPKKQTKKKVKKDD